MSMPEKNIMLSEVGVILKRRVYHITLPAILTMLLSIGLAFTLPPVYRSMTTILVEQQEIPDDLVSSTITGYAAERIERIRSQVMSKNTLLTIIKEFNLYPETMNAWDEDKAVSQMLEDTGMEMISAEALDSRKRSIKPTIAFSVFYENQSAILAQQVTAKLAELYLAENRRSRTEKAHTTSVFLDEETQRLGSEISDLEAKLANFKRQNADYLPESIERDQNQRYAAMLERNRLSAKIESYEESRNFLNRQLAQFGSLAKARKELSAARDKYSELHPDVITLKEAVEALEAKGSESYAPGPNNHEYLRLQSQLKEVLGNLRSAQAQIRALDRDIANYAARQARSPEVERQYLALTRDLNNATKKYHEIKDKLMEARLAEELEQKQKAERFTLINKANLPKTPIRPNRLGIILLGIMFALGSGIGVAAIAESLDRRIHNPRDLVAAFGALPLGTIPEIPSVN
jgi:uncharacterized protein involved in exopolysaccharide biosynthesis